MQAFFLFVFAALGVVIGFTLGTRLFIAFGLLAIVIAIVNKARISSPKTQVSKTNGGLFKS